MNAIVLTFDCLPVHVLGCYGSESPKTAYFDRLAAESVVFDRHYGEDFSRNAGRHAWSTGCYEFLNSGNSVRVGRSLWRQLADHGVAVQGVCETGSSFARLGIDGESRASCIDIHPAMGDDGLSANLLLRVKHSVQSLLAQSGRSFLLWIHAKGYSPTGDGTPRESADRVSPLDNQLGTLLNELRSLLEQDSLLILTADRGIPTIDEGQSRLPEFQLSSVVTQTPVFVRLPRGEISGRCRELSQSVDIAPTLLEWFRVDMAQSDMQGLSLLPAIRGERQLEREFLYLGAGELDSEVAERGIRSRDFYLIQRAAPAGTGQEPERYLFSKPDDQWEKLNVAEQFPDVVHDMLSRLNEFGSNPVAHG